MLTPISHKEMADAEGAFHSTANDAERTRSENDALDKLIDDVTEKISARYEAEDKAEAKDLDTAISDADEERESREYWSDTYRKSRDDRDTLRHYFDGNLRTAIQFVLNADTKLQSDPARAAQELAEIALRVPPGLAEKKRMERDAKAKKEDAPEGEHAWKKLDRIIEGSFDERDAKARDAQDAQDVADLCAEFQRRYPTLNFEDIMSRAVLVLGDLTSDPIGTASRLAASYGAPVLEKQFEDQHAAAAYQEQFATIASGVERVIASGKLPGLEGYADDIAEMLQHPDFHRTGDASTDLYNAYEAVVRYKAEFARGERVAKASRVGHVATSGTAPQVGMSGARDLDSAIESAMARVA